MTETVPPSMASGFSPGAQYHISPQDVSNVNRTLTDISRTVTTSNDGIRRMHREVSDHHKTSNEVLQGIMKHVQNNTGDSDLMMLFVPLLFSMYKKRGIKSERRCFAHFITVLRRQLATSGFAFQSWEALQEALNYEGEAADEVKKILASWDIEYDTFVNLANRLPPPDTSRIYSGETTLRKMHTKWLKVIHSRREFIRLFLACFEEERRRNDQWFCLLRGAPLDEETDDEEEHPNTNYYIKARHIWRILYKGGFSADPVAYLDGISLELTNARVIVTDRVKVMTMCNGTYERKDITDEKANATLMIKLLQDNEYAVKCAQKKQEL